jgi:uncharacterized membrane protein
LLAIDALRGLIIILMALDHANFFIAQQHSSGEYWGGPFPIYDHVLPFLTRFVTHICAPGFFFLMGVGMLLFAESRRKVGWSELRIMSHFWLRGGILMALQLILINIAWEQSPSGWGIEIYIGVLFALGLSMILASFLLKFNAKVFIILFLILLIGTELLVPDPSRWSTLFPLPNYLLLFAGGDYPVYWVNYPTLAWMEFVIFGLLFGRWIGEDKQAAYKRAFYLGILFILVFILLRTLNGFGNLRPRTGVGWMDFFNPVKYPPSITFTLITMGINLCLLRLFAWIKSVRPNLIAPLSVYGRVPLFFYVLHLFLYAFMGNWITPQGTSLLIMYFFWLLGVLILYPLCFRFGEFRQRQPVNSVIRLI